MNHLLGYSPPENSFDYEEWMKIINNYDINSYSTMSQAQINNLFSLLKKFLFVSPQLHLYWSKLALLTWFNTGSIDEVTRVFDEALAAKNLLYSFDMWNEYIIFYETYIRASNDLEMRKAYAKALDSIGWHYKSSPLWKKAMFYEIDHQRSILFYLAKALLNPLEELKFFYNEFQKAVSVSQGEISSMDLCMSISDYISVISKNNIEDPDFRTSFISKALLDYEKSLEEMNNRSKYETRITRQYFHFRAPDEAQISFWESYAQFCEQYGFLHVKRVYERAILPCAHIDAIWLEYAHYVEKNAGYESAEEIYERIPESICPKTLIHRLYFEEEYSTEKATMIAQRMSQSNLIELIFHSVHYLTRHPDIKVNINDVLNDSIERLNHIGDNEGVSAIKAFQSELLQSSYEKDDTSLSFSIYASQNISANPQEANQVLFDAIFNDEKLLIDERIQLCQSYLDLIRIWGVEGKFQMDVEMLLYSLKMKLQWHKDFFEQEFLISRMHPEKKASTWISYLKTIQ